MKLSLFTNHFRLSSILSVAALACLGFAIAPTSVSAQTSATKTITGKFKFKDGNKGTYVTTITKSDTGETEVTVLTRSSDKATSTDTTVTTDNTDGSKLVNYSHNDFGVTAQYTSMKTVTPEKHGEAYGTGTYTTADGVSGVLSTLETSIGKIVAVNATYTTATGVTRDLRLQDSELGFTADKIITIQPDGSVTTGLHTRYITHVE